MDEAPAPYLLDGEAEVERLRIQARLYEPPAEALLDAIGVGAGWTCADLGCGAMGILAPLWRRVGTGGRVVGLDLVPAQVAAARAYVRDERLTGVEVELGDAFASDLPRGSFDLVHARALATTCGRERDLLAAMIDLARPGGVVALQEPAGNPPQFFPPCPAHDRIWSAVVDAFADAGGDLAVGLRTFDLLRRAGLRDVQARAFTAALHDRHPYMRNVLQAAASLRPRILRRALASAAGLDADLAACEERCADPATLYINYTMTQVWGRKAG